MPKEILRYFEGYAKLKLTGLSIEKFINKVQSSDIILLNIKRNKYREVTLEVNRCDLGKVKDTAGQFGLEMEILGERGISYYSQRFFKHKSFALGMVVCILLLYLSASFVWKVEVVGNKTVSGKELMSTAKDLGIKPGILKSSIDHDKFVLGLLKKEKQLTWAELEISGVKAKISVAEGKRAPKARDYKTPCNVIADKDGFLVKLNALNGQKNVEEGNAVKKGQILVAGAVSTETSPVRYVHALGQAWANTYYYGEGQANITDFLYKKTGKQAVRYQLDVNGTVIPLYAGKVDTGFKKYSVSMDNKTLEGLGLNIPVRLRRVIYSEVYEMNYNDAKKLAQKKSEKLARDKALKAAPSDGKILHRKCESNVTTKGKIHSKVVLEVLEDIATEQKLIISEEDGIGNQP